MQTAALTRLVNFLNCDFTALANTAGESLRAKRRSRRSTFIGSTPKRNRSQKNAKLLAELWVDLESFVDPSSGEKKIQMAFKRILERINNIGLRPVWTVSGWDASNVNGRKASWLTVPTFRKFKNPAERLCALILATALDGSLLRLRKCKGCGIFFGRDKTHFLFCGSTCLDAFYSADAIRRVKESRERKRHKRHLDQSSTVVGKKSAGQKAEILRQKAPAMAIEAFDDFLVKSQTTHPERDEDWSSHFNKLPGANSERWQLLNEWVSAKKKGMPSSEIWPHTPERFRNAWIDD
jgi:hypothetical protein